MAGFDVILSCDFPQTFGGQLLVQVNGTSVFNISVTADVVPISLELSSKDIALSIQQSTVCHGVMEKILLTNNGNQEAVFMFERDEKSNNHTVGLYLGGNDGLDRNEPLDTTKMTPYNIVAPLDPSEIVFSSKSPGVSQQQMTQSSSSTTSIGGTFPPQNEYRNISFRIDSFFITPYKGIVPPFSTTPLFITFDPTALPTPPCSHPEGSALCSFSSVATMHIGGGNSQLLKLMGTCHEGKVEFQQKALHFGQFALGMECTRICVMKNVGQVDAVFFLSEYNKKLFNIRPTSGLVPPNATINITIIARNLNTMKFNEPITYIIRGGKKASIQMIGEIMEPSVEVVEKNIDMGEVVIGNSKKRVVTLVNSSPVDAVLWCDLSNAPGFKLAMKNREIEEPSLLQPKLMISSSLSLTLDTLNLGINIKENSENSCQPMPLSLLLDGFREALTIRVATENKKQGKVIIPTIPKTIKTIEPFGSPQSIEKGTWGKWGGVGAFDGVRRPLQGCVDLLGTNSDCENLEAFKTVVEEPLMSKNGAVDGDDDDDNSFVDDNKLKNDTKDNKDIKESKKVVNNNSKQNEHNPNGLQSPCEEMPSSYRIELKAFSRLRMDLIFEPHGIRSNTRPRKERLKDKQKESPDGFRLFFMLSESQSDARRDALVTKVDATAIPSILGYVVVIG
jgi:hypothetical protein